MRRFLRIVHNPSMAIILGLAFALAVHLAFAFGAYGAGLAISENVLQSLNQPGLSDKIAPITAFLYAALLFTASMWAFIYKNHTRKDVKAYDIDNGQQDSRLSTKNKLEVLIWLVGLLELSSLMFRLSLMPPSIGRIWLGVFGVVAWLCAYLLGDILHAVIHRPVENDLMLSQAQAERQVIEDSLKYLPQGTNEQRQRWRETGDPEILDEIKTAVDARKRGAENQKISKQEQKNQKKQKEVDDFGKAKAIKEKFFGRKRTSDPTPIMEPSSNGHSKDPVTF